ncbi:MAG: antitoxin family protein [Nitrospirae bacterium]|nr:antitoxin family protein [Nitrospirota bacterium]
MPKTINAIYENGVFKPLEPLSLKEHEKVTLDINLDERLRKQFKKLSETIYKRTDKYSSEEIEANITEAFREVQETYRAQKRSRSN